MTSPSNLPRVSMVLDHAWPRPPVPQARWQAGCERGTYVHQWPEDMEAGSAPIPPDKWSGYCDAYRTFTREFSPSWLWSEHTVGTNRYNGTLDRIGYLAGSGETLTVLDIKTGAARQVRPGICRDAIQLAAYALAYEPYHYKELQRVGLYLKNDGKFRVKLYDDLRDYDLWIEILNAYEER